MFPVLDPARVSLLLAPFLCTDALPHGAVLQSTCEHHAVCIARAFSDHAKQLITATIRDPQLDFARAVAVVTLHYVLTGRWPSRSIPTWNFAWARVDDVLCANESSIAHVRAAVLGARPAANVLWHPDTNAAVVRMWGEGASPQEIAAAVNEVQRVRFAGTGIESYIIASLWGIGVIYRANELGLIDNATCTALVSETERARRKASNDARKTRAVASS